MLSTFVSVPAYQDYSALVAYIKDVEAGNVAKRTVQYVIDDSSFIAVGHGAYVFAVDHYSPLTDGFGPVHTTEVQAYDKRTGVFETKNTIYVPFIEENVDTGKETVVQYRFR